MNQIQFERLDKTEAAALRLLRLFMVLDGAYVPPISSIVQLSEYTSKLIRLAEIVIARHDVHDIGLVALYANDLVSKCAFISSIGVKPDYQGKRVGLKLLLQAIEIADRKGMERIRLEVDIKNQIAHSFYRKAGFLEIDLRYYADDRQCLILERSVTHG
jgi:ribosomal protein S18 acetylase RimI-like enzyme